MQGKPPLHYYFAKLGPRTGCKRLEFVIFFDIFDIFDIAKLAKKSLNVEMSMIPPQNYLKSTLRKIFLKYNTYSNISQIQIGMNSFQKSIFIAYHP